ncbi:MAG TPA: hypothetical protein PKD00_07150, partial [Burkholderiales bacterium]|nr:hypothetical protein [Burkholderiales bacterium]
MKFISNMVFIAGTFALFACTAGTSTNQSISAAVASGSSCNPIANGGQCTINLTYNANGVSGLAL